MNWTHVKTHLPSHHQFHPREHGLYQSCCCTLYFKMCNSWIYIIHLSFRMLNVYQSFLVFCSFYVIVLVTSLSKCLSRAGHTGYLSAFTHCQKLYVKQPDIFHLQLIPDTLRLRHT